MPKNLPNEVWKNPEDESGEASAPLPWPTQYPRAARSSGSQEKPHSWEHQLQEPTAGAAPPMHELGGPSEPVDYWCPNSKPLLAWARLTQRAARWEQPWKKKKFLQLQCTQTPPRTLVPFQTMGFAVTELLAFASPQAVRGSYCCTTSREGQGRISWLMCAKAIRGWHEAVTQSHTSTLISSCQTLSAYFWYRFYTWAHVTHSGPHPQEISAPDCI